MTVKRGEERSGRESERRGNKNKDVKAKKWPRPSHAHRISTPLSNDNTSLNASFEQGFSAVGNEGREQFGGVGGFVAERLVRANALQRHQLGTREQIAGIEISLREKVRQWRGRGRILSWSKYG